MSTSPLSRRRYASARRCLSLAVIASLTLLLAPPVRHVTAQRSLRGRTPSAPLSRQTPSRKVERAVSSDPAPAPAAFTGGNLVIYRVGTGTGTLGSAATAVFLDEYATSGGSPVQSIAMPTADSGANQTLTAAGSSTSEGFLTLSTDGSYIMLTGYDAALGTASVAGTTSATVNRVVGRVDATGAVDTTTALSDAFSAGNIRSVTSDNGDNLWMSGSNSGVRYATLGDTSSSSISTTQTNLRQINIFDGQLYVSSGSGTNTTRGVNTVGTGTPTTGPQTTTRLPGLTDAGNPSSYGFFFADLDAGVTGVDTLYIADESSAASGGGIKKYSLVGGSWTSNGVAVSGTTNLGLRGLTGVVSGGNVTLFATSSTALYTLTDATGYNATITATPTSIATAATNTNFRGVAFAPAPAGDAAPTVSSTTPADDATNVALDSDITVTFSEAVSATADSFTVSCGTSGAHTFALSGSGSGPYTLNPDTDFANSETCTVTVVAAEVTDADTEDPPDGMEEDFSFDFTTVSATPSLTINDVSLDEGSGGGTTAFSFTVSLSTSTHGGVTFDICTADGTAQDGNPAGDDTDYTANCLTGQTIANGSDTYPFTVQVNADTAAEPNENFFVNVTNVVGATVTDGQGQGTIVNDEITITPIHNIQGNGASSPFDGQVVTTTGIVTLLRTGSNAGNGTASGFFLQTASPDADPNTSEGIFIFTSSVPTYTSPATPVAVGDELRVTGTVDEFGSGGTMTELTSVTNITAIDTGNTLPTAVTIDSTILVPSASYPQPQLEKYEAMRMTASLKSISPNDGFMDVITVLPTVPREQAFREPGIPSGDPIPPDPTTGTPDCCIPIWDRNPERLKLDTNGRAGSPNVAYTSNVTFTNVAGPLDFAFGEYRLIPDAALSASANMSAVPVPTPTADEFMVASYNIENFNNNATQRQKAALTVRDVLRLPEIIGTIEIFDLADLEALAAEINSISTGVNYVARLEESDGGAGGDNDQDVGFLVDTNRVTITSTTREREEETYAVPGGGTDTLHDRPPFVLDAIVDPSGANPRRVIVVVNHLRSFISVDLVAGDGPRVREKRKKQAESLADLLDELQDNNPGVPVISVGDYNAFQFSSGYDDSMSVLKGSPAADDVIVVDQSPDLVDPNFFNLTEELPASERYSFFFDDDGAMQMLDHHLINTAARQRNTRAAVGRVNSDFPGTPSSAFASDATRPEHNSDHDPVVSYYTLSDQQAAGALIISEFRLRGPGPTPTPSATATANDEFIEVYNNTDADITVQTTDGSAGYALVTSANPAAAHVVIPNGEVIPARGHYLVANSDGYTLNVYAEPDLSYTGDIPDNVGVALFNTSNPAFFNSDNRLDAAGPSTEANALFKEGTGYAPLTSNPTAQFSFYRDLFDGPPKDTNSNASDFIYVSTDAADSGAGSLLGAPGPENTSSPIQRNGAFGAFLLDAQKAQSAPPNRERDPEDDGANATFGTLTLRRRIVNNTTENVTTLRFRVVQMTTFPATEPGSADLRALSSSPVEISNILDQNTCDAAGAGPAPCTVAVNPTILEEPPAQPNGGGYNSSLVVPLSAPLEPGQSVNVAWRLGVVTPGKFKFYVNMEALTSPAVVVESDSPFTKRRRSK